MLDTRWQQVAERADRAGKQRRYYAPGKPNKQLPFLDGRTKASTRYKALCKALAGDLGRAPSVRESALIRQAAAAIVSSESVQGLVLSGTASEAELAEQSKLANVICRLLATLGMGNAGGSAPDLDRYLDGESDAQGKPVKP